MKRKLTLENIPKQTVFQVPEGYFDKLLQQIQTRLPASQSVVIHAEKPLSEYSVIHDLSKDTIFAVPPRYFETLYERIKNRLDTHAETALLNFSALHEFESDLNTKEMYAVPKNYFENLPDQILAKIVSSTTQKPLPLDFSVLEEAELGIMATIPKQNVFQLPENYFEKLSIQPEEQLEAAAEQETEKEAKVVHFIPGWARYAATLAASVLVLLMGYWFYPKNAQTPAECTELLCNLSDDEILQYLETQDVRFATNKTAAPAAKPLEDNVLEQYDIGEDDLLNAAESIE